MRCPLTFILAASDAFACSHNSAVCSFRPSDYPAPYWVVGADTLCFHCDDDLVDMFKDTLPPNWDHQKEIDSIKDHHRNISRKLVKYLKVSVS